MAGYVSAETIRQYLDSPAHHYAKYIDADLALSHQRCHQRMHWGWRNGRTKRVQAIHAQIANCRKNWAHQTTTAMVKRAKLIVVGNVSSRKPGKTPMAKSVHDAGWGQLRTCLQYKAMRLGVMYSAVNESGSSVTCSTCLARTGPSGLSALGVRVWCCTACGAVHDRDHNASRHILRLGRQALAGIPRL